MWCQAGYDPDSFWKQTPRTLQQALGGYRRRREAEIEALAYQALVSAGLSRWPKSKRLPSLKYLLGEGKKGPAKIQSADELAANARAWGLYLKQQAKTETVEE